MAVQFQDIQVPSTGVDSTIPAITILAVGDSQIPEAPIETARSIQKTRVHGGHAQVRVTVLRLGDNLAP